MAVFLPVSASCGLQETVILPDFRQERPAALPEPHKREWFDRLRQAIRKEPFHDKQMELLYDAAARHRVSANEIIRLMQLYTFDKERMEVLNIMAPALYDRRNGERIVKVFTFDDDRQKARDILNQSRQPRRPASDSDIESLYHQVKEAFPTAEKMNVLRQGPAGNT